MRRRILVSMVALTALAVVVLAVPLGIAIGRVYRDREVSRLERDATRLVAAIPPDGLHAGDPIELPAASRHIVHAVYDDRGALVTGDGPATAPVEVRAALAGRVTDNRDGTTLAAAVPIHANERVVGAVRAAEPWQVVAGHQRSSWLLISGIAALALAASAAVAWRLSSRLVVPVDQLARFAVRLGDGDFSSRVALPGPPELNRAADALNRTADRLGDRLARERAFTSDVSHQLNTPLTSLRLGLESALITPDTDLAGAVGAAVDEVERLERTVATLLAMARDQTEAASCDATSVCEDVADRCRGALAATARPLRLELDRQLPAAACPADALREIVTVLVDNATRHGRGAVTMRTRAAGGGVIVEVEDEGPGLTGDPAEAFMRRSATATGHGIGLALARSLAEAHGARLHVSRARPHPVFMLAMPPVGA
jgi:signal transduction histidine kinase